MFALITTPISRLQKKLSGAIAELLIPGAFLVDIIPILKYVPEWFPGAKFQGKVAAMRKHGAIMRNATFAASEELMVCDLSPFLGFLLDDMHIPGQR